MALLLLLLLSPAAVLSFLDRAAGLHLFALPELRSPHQRRLQHAGEAGKGYRRLPCTDGAYPAVHDSHDFVGATSLGFVVYNHSSILKSTTVVTDDYLALLSSASLACAPRALPPPHTSQGHMILTIAFPAGISDAEALEHLATRLTLPGAVLVLGVDTLLSHADLGDASSCLAHAAGAPPYFALAAPAQRSGSTLTLHLSPASPQSAFEYLRMELAHTPDAAAGAARRRAAGLYAGRALAVNPQPFTLSSSGVNWNGLLGSSAAANTNTLAFNPTVPSALYCQNCFFYLQATLNVQLQVCAITSPAVAATADDAASTPYTFYDANNGVLSTGITSAASDSLGVLTRAQTDCAALSTTLPQVGSTLLVNAGLSASAWLEGAEGFSYTIKSSGISSLASSAVAYPDGKVNAFGLNPDTLPQCLGAAATGVCSAALPQCSGTSSTTCTPALLPGTTLNTLPLISFAAGAAPLCVAVSMGLAGAAIVSVSGPSYNMQLGTSATAAIKLGGAVSFTGVAATPAGPLGLTTSTFSTFTPIYTTTPFQLSGFGGVGFSDVTITPTIKLALFATSTAQVSLWSSNAQVVAWANPPSTVTHALQGTLQFTLVSQMNFKSTLALSTVSGSGNCSVGAFNAITGTTGAVGVALANVDILKLVGALVVPTAPTKLQANLPLALAAGIPLFSPSSQAQLPLLSPASASFSTAGALDPGASTCVAVGGAINTAASATPSPSPTPSRTPAPALPAPFAMAAQDALSTGMVSLLQDPLGQSNQVASLAAAAYVPAVLGPLVLYLLSMQTGLLRPPAEAPAPAIAQSHTSTLPTLKAAAYLLLQGCAMLGAALGLPWVTFSPAFTLFTMYATGQQLCTTAATATCTPTAQVTAGLALLAAAGLCSLGALLLTCAMARRLHALGAEASPASSTLPPQSLGLLAVPLALAGVIMSYIGTASFQAFVPPGIMAQARAGPSPGGAAAILGLLCLLAGCAALGLAEAAMRAAAAAPLQGKPSSPPTPPQAPSQQQQQQQSGPPPPLDSSQKSGSPGGLTTRSAAPAVSSSERTGSPSAARFSSAATAESISRRASYHSAPLQQEEKRYSIYQDLGDEAPLSDPAVSHAQVYASAVERLSTIQRAALVAEEEVRAAESAMRRRAEELSLRAAQLAEEAENIERVHSSRLSAGGGGSGSGSGGAAVSPQRALPAAASEQRSPPQALQPPSSGEVLELIKALPTSVFIMLKRKGALSAAGEALRPVVLSAEEEHQVGSAELLVRLALLNICVPPEAAPETK